MNRQFDNNRYNGEARRRAARRRRQMQTAILAVLLVLLIAACVLISLGIKGQFDPKDPGSDLPGITDAPITDDPATDGTDEPATDAPVTDAPITDAPVISVGFPVICLDPGHGFDDPGTSSELLGGVFEKDIAFRAKKLLEDRGYSVIMTRDSDTNPPGENWYLFNPKKRIEFFNKHPEIDLFVSVHCNSFESDTTVNGTRIYYCQSNNPSRTPILASCVASAIDKYNASARASRCFGMAESEAYAVTRGVTVPSILIETGFVTNPEDAAAMLSDEWRDNMAAGIADGVIAYIASVGGIY